VRRALLCQVLLQVYEASTTSNFALLTVRATALPAALKTSIQTLRFHYFSVLIYSVQEGSGKDKFSILFLKVEHAIFRNLLEVLSQD